MSSNDKIANEANVNSEDSESLTRISVVLGFGSLTLDPNEITGIMGISPSHSFYHGEECLERIDGHMRIRGACNGVWQLDSGDHIKSVQIEDHISWLMKFLEPKAKEVQRLMSRDGMSVSIRISLDSEEDGNSFDISSRHLAFFSSICHYIHFYVLGHCSKEEMLRPKKKWQPYLYEGRMVKRRMPVSDEP